MDMEQQVREAIVQELRRQSENEGGPSVEGEQRTFTVNGPIDLEALSMAVVGAVAGGP